VTTPILSAEHLTKRFDNGVLAVDDVSITVHPGETVGIVGESGCGKSTTGKLILGLLKPTAGSVAFDGVDLGSTSRTRLQSLRAKLQLVPQNPQTSLNPRLTITEAIVFNLRSHQWTKRDAATRVADLLDRVGVPTAYAHRYPHELSGGQLQRVAIARALSTDPKLIVCDEAVSALDKSVQAQVLNLLADLQRERGVAYLFISHDLAVVEHLSHRVVVMYLGRIVEESSAHDLWQQPAHPYTEALFSSVPGPGRQRMVLSGDLPSPAHPPSGCGFRTRCPAAVDACSLTRPEMVTVTAARPDLDEAPHQAACVRIADGVTAAGRTRALAATS
jgi:oligopeptide/dipeptide ABC transporter ATP-binding protein